MENAELKIIKTRKRYRDRRDCRWSLRKGKELESLCIGNRTSLTGEAKTRVAVDGVEEEPDRGKKTLWKTENNVGKRGQERCGITVQEYIGKRLKTAVGLNA